MKKNLDECDCKCHNCFEPMDIRMRHAIACRERCKICGRKIKRERKYIHLKQCEKDQIKTMKTNRR